MSNYTVYFNNLYRILRKIIGDSNAFIFDLFPDILCQCSIFLLDNSTLSGERFDVRGDSREAIPNMLEGRYAHELVSLEGFVFVLGGQNESRNYLKTVEKINPEKNEWISAPSMIQPRSHFGAAIINAPINTPSN